MPAAGRQRYNRGVMRTPPGPARPALLPAAALLAATLLAGCAHVHVDGEGRRHVVGLVWMTLPPAPVEPVGADALRVRALGASVIRTPAGGGVAVGWTDTTVTVIRNDALVRMPAPQEAPR